MRPSCKKCTGHVNTTTAIPNDQGLGSHVIPKVQSNPAATSKKKLKVRLEETSANLR